MKTKEKSAFALEDTLAVYGIHKNPFPIDETDDVFFSTAMLAKQMEVLRNLLEFSDLLLVVSGVEGAGKTTFLNQFLLAPDSRWRCCRIDAGKVESLATLHHELLTGFGLNAGDDEESDEALLRARLGEMRAGGSIAIVAVDDAHLLPQVCSEFLLTLAEERERMDLRLLLTTEPGRLGFPTDDAKRVHVVVLQPFDAQQSGDYIHTRLSAAGLGGDSPFDAAVVDALHQDSGGVPGTIHALALHTLLANTDMARLSRPKANMTRAGVYLVALLVAALGAALFLSSSPDVAPAIDADAGTSGELRGRIAGVGTQGTLPVADAGSPQEQKSRDTESRPFTGSIRARPPSQQAHGAKAETVTVLSGNEAKVSALEQGGATPKPAVVVEPPAATKGVTSANITPAVRLAANVTPALGVPAAARAAHDLDWLRRQDPSSYVIQLVGTRDAAAVGRFLEEHKLGSSGAWFVTSLDNKPWYVVVYGIYPSRAEARAAIPELPRALRAGAPWPRSVASVVDSAR